MSKFDTLLEEYKKALAYPEQKRSELAPMIAALTEKEHAAKAAFNNAVNDGEDANALYMSWKAVKDELGMLQAKHRPALVGCRPGDKGSREGKNHDHYTWHQVFV